MGPTTILNGFGISLGDGIIGLQALFAARQLKAIEGGVVLARIEPPAKPLVPQLYRLAADLAEVVPMSDAPVSGRVIDIRDFAFDPFFGRVAMIDFFLTRLGLRPETVPSCAQADELACSPRRTTGPAAGGGLCAGVPQCLDSPAGHARHGA